MKRLLLALFVFFSLTTRAQSNMPPGTESIRPAFRYEIRGYLQGVRLDSLPSKYIYVRFLGGNIIVDYGQEASSREQQVTSSDGLKIRFDKYNTASYGTFFNFLDYNGWEYVDNWVDSDPKYSDKYFIFKKKS